MPISAFATTLAQVAEDQHDRFHFIQEGDPALCRQIASWTTDIGFTFSSCTRVAWSAVFVSWCVKEAGATRSEFKFAMAHSVFVHQAIKNAEAGAGVFQAHDVSAHAPQVGDIIHHNRGGNRRTFAFAREHAHYESHSVIVTEVGEDAQGRFAFCIGGNESDSVRRTIVRLDDDGLIKQRIENPYISVIQNLK